MLYVSTLWAHRYSYQRLIGPRVSSEEICASLYKACTVANCPEDAWTGSGHEKRGERRCICPSSSVVSSSSGVNWMSAQSVRIRFGALQTLNGSASPIPRPPIAAAAGWPLSPADKIPPRRPDKRKREEKEEKSASVRLDKREALLTDWRIFSQRMFWMRAFSAPGSNAISPG